MGCQNRAYVAELEAKLRTVVPADLFMETCDKNAELEAENKVLLDNMEALKAENKKLHEGWAIEYANYAVSCDRINKLEGRLKHISKKLGETVDRLYTGVYRQRHCPACSCLLSETD